MKERRCIPTRPSGGFTLMELIIVIVVLAIASTGIAALMGNIFSDQTSVKELQERTRIMEECAEQVLAVRQHTPDGYEEVNTIVPAPAVARFGAQHCDTIPARSPSYGTPTVSVNAYSGTLCPQGRTCKTVTIDQSGKAALTLMLVDY